MNVQRIVAGPVVNTSPVTDHIAAVLCPRCGPLHGSHLGRSPCPPLSGGHLPRCTGPRITSGGIRGPGVVPVAPGGDHGPLSWTADDLRDMVRDMDTGHSEVPPEGKDFRADAFSLPA